MKVDCVIRTEMFDERRVTTTKAIRLDSIPLDKTYYTEEGYLVDHPILTSCGIFEYANPDGSIRRELRLPEEVFNDKSLESYEGKPIIVTHDAGKFTNAAGDGTTVALKGRFCGSKGTGEIAPVELYNQAQG